MTGNPQGRAGRSASERVFLGFGGLYASIGDHIGHFYHTKDEWKDLLIPFLKVGLEAGHKCVYLMSPGAGWQKVRVALAAAGIDVDGALASEQLILDEGKTTPEELGDWLTSIIAEIPLRFRLLRWGGDMTWSLQKMPTSEALMEWETICNTMDGLSAVFLCQYDLTQFRGSVVIDALKTHPLCIVSNVIHQNPFYEKPEVFLEELRRRQAP